MESRSLLALPSGLRVDDIVITDHNVTIAISSHQRKSRCPHCARQSHRIHSHYLRTITDLASSGRSVTLHLQVRKFFCDGTACPVKIFTERLPDFLVPSARKTNRLRRQIVELGLALGGRATERLAPHLGIQVSDTTVLRHLLPAPVAPLPVVTVLGVDDFSFRRGRTFGTILVDLQRHQVVALLPDRSQITFALWLKNHPEVQVISRDRGGDYAAGAHLGAPHAMQVADRFHLIKNAGEVLERLLTRHHLILTQAAASLSPADASPRQRRNSPLEQHQHDARRGQRLANYTQAVALFEQGMPVRQVARETGLARGTVLSYLRTATFPEQAPRPRPRTIDPYVPFLREQWNAGEHNARALWRVICQQGFVGGEAPVRRVLHAWRADPHKRGRSFDQDTGIAHREQRCYSSMATRWLFAIESTDRSPNENRYLAFIQQACPEIATAVTMLRQFQEILMTHDQPRFPLWLHQCEHCEIAELVGFAGGIRRDEPAVQAGIETQWSQGQVEGHVNRLKMRKRQLYGRAGFALRQRRVLSSSLIA